MVLTTLIQAVKTHRNIAVILNITLPKITVILSQYCSNMKSTANPRSNYLQAQSQGLHPVTAHSF